MRVHRDRHLVVLMGKMSKYGQCLNVSIVRSDVDNEAFRSSAPGLEATVTEDDDEPAILPTFPTS